MNRKLLLAAGALGLGTLYLASRGGERVPGSSRVRVVLVKSSRIHTKWQAMGAERGVGRPVAPLVAIPGLVVQSFKRADGDRQTIYDSPRGTFIVRGGFRRLYEGREGLFGLPTSDEVETKVSAAKALNVPATVSARVQTFERGRMIYLKKRERLIAFASVRVPMVRDPVTRLIYDSRPPPSRRSWYEDIGAGDVLLVLASPIIAPALVVAGIGAAAGPTGLSIAGTAANAILPGFGNVAVEFGTILADYECRGAGAINSATGTGAPEGNKVCRKFAEKVEPSTPFAVARGTVKAYAGAEGA